MLITKYFSLLLVLASLLGAHLVSAATWKVFFYMDSSDSLSDMAFKNITDMVRAKPNDSVDFVIQLHAYFNAGLRFKVSNEGSLQFIEETTLTGDCKQDFIDAALWAFSNNNADYTMLIFSNHGWGILDPHWNEETKEWQAAHDSLSNSCPINKGPCTATIEHINHKGYMFRVNPRAYLTNQDQIESLSYIQEFILGGEKIDIIAFDTCMGSMLEVGYQLAPFAHYLVGSQSCSLTDGFDYQGLIQLLNKQLPPKETAKSMVNIFDSYYRAHDASGIYTHAALDLNHVYSVRTALDAVVAQLLITPELSSIIADAHENTPRFCLWPMYTDLVSFCKLIDEQLTSLDSSEQTALLHNIFVNLYESANKLALNHCGGHRARNHAHGFAVYLPVSALDESYGKTQFAQECRWPELLHLMCDNMINTSEIVANT